MDVFPCTLYKTGLYLGEHKGAFSLWKQVDPQGHATYILENWIPAIFQLKIDLKPWSYTVLIATVLLFLLRDMSLSNNSNIYLAVLILYGYTELSNYSDSLCASWNFKIKFLHQKLSLISQKIPSRCNLTAPTFKIFPGGIPQTP